MFPFSTSRGISKPSVTQISWLGGFYSNKRVMILWWILIFTQVEKEEWLRRLEEREGVWRARLSAVDQQYKKQVTELQDRLNTSRLEGKLNDMLMYLLKQSILKTALPCFFNSFLFLLGVYSTTIVLVLLIYWCINWLQVPLIHSTLHFYCDFFILFLYFIIWNTWV